MIYKNEKQSLKQRSRQQTKTDGDKKLLSLMREYRRLQEGVRNAQVIKLSHPYQRGWIRHYRLTKKASRRKNAHQLKAVMDIVDCPRICRNKKFTEWCGRNKRKVPIPHKFHPLTPYSLLKAPNEILKYFHHPQLGCDLTKAQLRRLALMHWGGLFEIDCLHHFTLVIEPWFVTHQKVDMPELKSRIAELEAYFENNNGWHRFHHLHGYSWKWHANLSRYEKRKRIDEREIQEALQEDSITISEQKGTTKIVPFLFLFQIPAFTPRPTISPQFIAVSCPRRNNPCHSLPTT